MFSKQKLKPTQKKTKKNTMLVVYGNDCCEFVRLAVFVDASDVKTQVHVLPGKTMEIFEFEGVLCGTRHVALGCTFQSSHGS